jgi:crotonobetainyl-CoA:carnitine CoA-transferase CaiB-like acyl-CoA transferase
VTLKTERPQLLEGLLVLDCSILGPGLAGGLLADLGARVIKIESRTGDDLRRVTWPIIHERNKFGEITSNSLFHLHVNRSKESLNLDLSVPEAIQVFEDLVRRADVVIEGMRPRFLERKGLTFERLVELNPSVVMCSISGFGTGSPYETFPSHGVGFDAWCGVIRPDVEPDGSLEIPDQVNVGMTFGPVLAATAVLAAVIRARSTGMPAFIELSQSDAAAYFDWYRIETERAYQRPDDEVTGVVADDGRRRAPGLAGLRGAVRYQFYKTADGHILFMASERKFWKNFCDAVQRIDLFERWPGAEVGDHALGNLKLKAELREIFAANSTREWMMVSETFDVPIIPANSHDTLMSDPQFMSRFHWWGSKRLGADQMELPLRLDGGGLAEPRRAPEHGEHNEIILTKLLGYNSEQVKRLREVRVIPQEP